MPWFCKFRSQSLFQSISRLRKSISALFARHDKRCVTVAIAVPLALIALVLVYVLVALPESRARLNKGSTAPQSAPRASVTGAMLRADEHPSKPLIVTSANSALDQSSVHWVSTESDDLHWPLLDLEIGAPSSSAAQNIAQRTAAVERGADKTGETQLTKAHDKHEVPKSVTKKLDASAVKPSTSKHKSHIADAPQAIITRYQAKQLILIRKSARFGAPTIQKIAKGTPVGVLGVNNSWAEVTVTNDLNENVTGFVRVEFLGLEAYADHL